MYESDEMNVKRFTKQGWTGI